MTVSTGDLVSQLFTTTSPSTGAALDADSLPSGALFVNGVANAATVTIADVAGTGRYKFSVTMPTIVIGDRVQVLIDATIEGLACTGEVWADSALANNGGLTAQQTRDAMKLAPTAGTPADGSIDDHLDDLATALAAATSTLTVVSAVDGDVITIYQAVTFAATISGLAIPAGWTKIYWTVKRSAAEGDTDAILQIVETNPAAGTDGLLRLNGAAGTAANGTLTVSQADGTVVIDLVDDVTDDLALASGLLWSLKALYPTSAAALLATGTLNVLGQATAAVS